MQAKHQRRQNARSSEDTGKATLLENRHDDERGDEGADSEEKVQQIGRHFALPGIDQRHGGIFARHDHRATQAQDKGKHVQCFF